VKYEISRTSKWDKKPCDEAIEIDCKRRDERLFKSPDEYQKQLREDWFSKGSDHGYWERGGQFGIVRHFPSKAWVVEVDDLLAFCRKYGQLVISEHYDTDAAEMELEIYDGYRE
jgi:hypothetical protein